MNQGRVRLDQFDYSMRGRSLKYPEPAAAAKKSTTKSDKSQSENPEPKDQFIRLGSYEDYGETELQKFDFRNSGTAKYFATGPGKHLTFKNGILYKNDKIPVFLSNIQNAENVCMLAEFFLNTGVFKYVRNERGQFIDFSLGRSHFKREEAEKMLQGVLNNRDFKNELCKRLSSQCVIVSETDVADTFKDMFSRIKSICNCDYQRVPYPCSVSGGYLAIPTDESKAAYLSAVDALYPMEDGLSPADKKERISNRANHVAVDSNNRILLEMSGKGAVVSQFDGFISHHSQQFGFLGIEYKRFETVKEEVLEWNDERLRMCLLQSTNLLLSTNEEQVAFAGTAKSYCIFWKRRIEDPNQDNLFELIRSSDNFENIRSNSPVMIDGQLEWTYTPAQRLFVEKVFYSLLPCMFSLKRSHDDIAISASSPVSQIRTRKEFNQSEVPTGDANSRLSQTNQQSIGPSYGTSTGSNYTSAASSGLNTQTDSLSGTTQQQEQELMNGMVDLGRSRYLYKGSIFMKGNCDQMDLETVNKLHSQEEEDDHLSEPDSVNSESPSDSSESAFIAKKLSDMPFHAKTSANTSRRASDARTLATSPSINLDDLTHFEAFPTFRL